MENSAETKNDLTYSMKSGFLARVKFERAPVMADITASYCTNPFCSCRDVTLDFFDASDKFDNRLFRLVVNYETWQLESYEALNHNLDYTEIADEFMSSLDDQFKADILSKLEPKARKEHTLRDDISLSRLDDSRMVLYSEIYHIEPFEEIFFEFNGNEYYVLDQYCPKPKCDCKDVVLTFYLIEEEKIRKNPILAYRVKFDTGRGIVEDKDADVSLSFANDLYGGLSKAFGGSAISFFEHRYRKIKEWGAVYFGVKDTQVKTSVPKTGRNDPCPCGSGKKYKKCCGSGIG